MKAMKVAMKVSMKTMKAPKSMKTIKAATAKGKSEKAKDKSSSAKDKSIYTYDVKNAKVCFNYWKKRRPKAPSELAMIARVLSVGVVASGANQVTALYVGYGKRRHARTLKLDA